MHSSNLGFQSKFATLSPCSAAGDALAAHARLPRPHGRRADLRVSGIREAPSAAHGRSLSAKHLAGSIHVVFAPVCVVSSVCWGWRMRRDCSRWFLPFGSWPPHMEFCSRGHRPRRSLVGGRVSVDRRGRLWRLRRVPNFRSILDSTLAGRSIDCIGACLSRPWDEAARFIAGVGSTTHPPADGAARIAFDCLPMAAGSRGRHWRDRRRVRDTRHCGRSPSTLPTVSHVLTVMDAPWMDVVRERSQFLFLQLWSIHDWDINAQPIHFFGVHGSRGGRRADTQTLRCGGARGSRRFGSGVHRRSHRPGRDIGARSSLAVGLDCRLHQRCVGSLHGLASVAR